MRTGSHHSKETIQKMCAALKGKIPWNKGRKGMQPCWHKGQHWSEETKQKIKQSLQGRTLSETVRDKISKALSGRKLSEEVCQRRRGRPKTEEHKRKIGQSNSISLKGRVPWNKGKEFMKGEKNPRWKGGISFEPYCHKFNNRLKELIRERDNRTCQLCGEKENGIKLDVHHIHYDKPNCNPDLIALCKCCNSKANGKRDYWENYFMEKLKERGLF